jgi:hypothetical protein
LHHDHDWDDEEVRCLTDGMPSPKHGDGRRRFTHAALGGDGRRRFSPSPSNVPVDCRACWVQPRKEEASLSKSWWQMFV